MIISASFSALFSILNFFTVNTNTVTGDSKTVSHKTFVSPQSDSLNLSRFKGKVVILNFWASWSKASRAENKNLVRLYQVYKLNPKVVFVSISLDTDETSWKTAIDEDNLEWKNHLCDFRKYDSPLAKAYQASTIPVIHLIDKTGNVAKKGTKVQDIESEIAELLK